MSSRGIAELDPLAAVPIQGWLSAGKLLVGSSSNFELLTNHNMYLLYNNITITVTITITVELQGMRAQRQELQLMGERILFHILSYSLQCSITPYYFSAF